LGDRENNESIKYLCHLFQYVIFWNKWVTQKWGGTGQPRNAVEGLEISHLIAAMQM